MYIIIYLIGSFLINIILLMMMKDAPEGWEDKDGFHFGKGPEQFDEFQIDS